ncbi:TPA: DUF551 domain-containing protein [Escherichia coli]
MSTITKESIADTIEGLEHLANSGIQSVYIDMAIAGMRRLLASLEAEAVPEWTNEQCMEFLSIAFRHAEINGDLQLDDIRLGVKMVNGSRAAMLQGSQHVSQTYNLPELIEGMEVSIDVSTCDADLGNRYFGTVTEALELDTAKNGYILLVQDAEPNFDVNGNSPVTPDGWISCSERMPDDGQHVIILCDGAFVLYAQYRDGEFFDIVRNGDEFFETQSRNVTDWMPLPEPPEQDGE